MIGKFSMGPSEGDWMKLLSIKCKADKSQFLMLIGSSVPRMAKDRSCGTMVVWKLAP